MACQVNTNCIEFITQNNLLLLYFSALCCVTTFITTVTVTVSDPATDLDTHFSYFHGLQGWLRWMKQDLQSTSNKICFMLRAELHNTDKYNFSK